MQDRDTLVLPQDSRFSQSPTRSHAGFAIPRHEKRHRFLGFECSTVRARISPRHTLSAFPTLVSSPFQKSLTPARPPALRDLILLARFLLFHRGKISVISSALLGRFPCRVTTRHRCFVINTSPGIDKREDVAPTKTPASFRTLAKQIEFYGYFQLNVSGIREGDNRRIYLLHFRAAGEGGSPHPRQILEREKAVRLYACQTNRLCSR